MLKYLSIISQRLEKLKEGIQNNTELWNSIPGNSLNIQPHIDEINNKNAEIEQLKNDLSQKYAEARILRDGKKKIIEKFRKRAIGIHIDEPEKLSEYGITITL